MLKEVISVNLDVLYCTNGVQYLHRMTQGYALDYAVEPVCNDGVD